MNCISRHHLAGGKPAVLRPRRSLGCLLLIVLGALGLAESDALAQSLRFGYGGQLTPTAPRFAEGQAFGSRITYRTPTKGPPDYATLRIGPFYSTWLFTQTAGYRWTRTRGNGTDYLYQNHRGVIKEDGSEFPLRSSLEFQNYMLITPNMDLDLSVGIYYAHYPLGTQDDEFYVSMAPEGVFGTLSTVVDWTPFVRSMFYDSIEYRTDYIDTRGISDRFGGTKYSYFDNVLGANSDWQLAKDKDIIFELSREDFIPQSSEFKDQERITYREAAAYEQAVWQGLVIGARAGYSQTDYRVDTRPDTRSQEYSIYARFGGGEGLSKAGENGLRMWLSELSTLTVGIGYYSGVSGSVTAQTSTQGSGFDTGTGEASGVSGFATLKTQLRRDLRHELAYRRGLRGGFTTSWEEFEEYRYQIWWDGAATKASAFSALTRVRPVSDVYNEYSDWASGVSVNYPLVSYIRLFLDSTYTVRNNKGQPSLADPSVELTTDYTTWDSRIGTSFGLTRSIDFLTYYEHTERWSESDDLQYVRDTFEAMFIYRHRF